MSPYGQAAAKSASSPDVCMGFSTNWIFDDSGIVGSLWVRNRRPSPQPFLSAFGGKADVQHACPKSPLIARSGHWSPLILRFKQQVLAGQLGTFPSFTTQLRKRLANGDRSTSPLPKVNGPLAPSLLARRIIVTSASGTLSHSDEYASGA